MHISYTHPFVNLCVCELTLTLTLVPTLILTLTLVPALISPVSPLVLGWDAASRSGLGLGFGFGWGLGLGLDWVKTIY